MVVLDTHKNDDGSLFSQPDKSYQKVAFLPNWSRMDDMLPMQIEDLSNRQSIMQANAIKFKSSNPVVFNENMYRPSDIEPGTVGAELFGCDQSYYGVIDNGCSALCVDKSCRRQIWLMKGRTKELECLHKPDTHEAYLFVTGRACSQWKPSTEHQKQLVTAGVKNCVLIRTIRGRHQELGTFSPEFAIEINDENIVTVESSNVIHWVTAGVIILLLVVILVYMKLR